MSEITERLKLAIAERYLVESELGQGGMATVYLAHDVKHDRKVALKVLRPELAAVIGAERFLQEIKVTANLQHSHILPLYDSGAAASFLYYVMPYVEGETLRTELEREKQLGIEQAVELTRKIAAALEHAHKQGIIHRDIKPENVLMRDGDPLIADFGIALAVSHAGANRLTETGLSIGTPQYMSPEQAMGDRELDARSDVYSLAAMLFEMLTGDPPYQGSTAQAVVAKVITEKAPSVTVLRDTVPGHVAAAIAKALNKLPADRWRSAAEFAEALVNPGMVSLPATRASEAAVAERPARRLPIAAAAGAAIVLGAAGLLLGRFTAPKPSPRLTEFVVTLPDSVTGIGRCCSAGLALSPDGSRLVFVGASAKGYRLFSRLAGRVDAEPIPGTEDAAAPFFSPDGRWLGFQAGSRLRKVALAGGPAINITDITGNMRNASWGDDDQIVFSAGRRVDRLYRVPASGGTAQPLREESSAVSHRHPTILPGSRRVLFTLDPLSAGPDADRIAVLDLKTGAIDTLVTGTRAYYAAGHLLFTTSDGSLLTQPFDPASGRLSGQAVSLFDAVMQHPDGNADFAVSRSGDVAYFPSAGGESNETLMLVNGRTQTPVTMPRPVNFEDPAVAPDGRRIAMRLTDESGQQDIWVFDRGLGTLTRLTVEGGNAMPVWSPDGRQIAFASNRADSGWAVYVQPSDGSGAARLVLQSSAPYLAPAAWLRDGRFVVVRAGAPGTAQDVGVATPGDTAVQWIAGSSFQEHQPAVSPDERWIAYASNRSGDFEVYVQALSGAGAVYQVSVGGGGSPRWSPDGRTLYYANAEGNGLLAARITMTPQFNVSAREPVLQGAIDLNGINSNYNVVPRTGELLVILQGVTNQASQRIVWVQHWPEILREMAQQR